MVSEKITEETGVTVHFITPMGNETEKLNALIASDSLPDLITIGYWEPQVKTIIESQMVYSLNELAEDYDIYFWKDTKEDVVKSYTMEDGNITVIHVQQRHCRTMKKRKSLWHQTRRLW